MSNLNVAIDLHGTYDSHPELFEREVLSIPGVNFFLLTGSPAKDVISWRQNNILLDEGIISIVDFCIEQGLPMTLRESPRSGRKTWYFAGSELVWWSMKSILCLQHKIHLLIDDTPDYNLFFGQSHQTRFLLYDKTKDIPEQLQYMRKEIIRMKFPLFQAWK